MGVFLEEHKLATEKKLNELKGKGNSLEEKGAWLVRYHNKVIERLSAINSGFSQFRISE